MTATRGWRIAGRLAAGLAVLVLATLNALVWLFVSGFQCDESCDAFSPSEAARRGVSWHDTAGAWQWSAIGGLGLACFVCGLAGTVAVIAGRRAPARACLALACLTGVIPWVMVRL